MKIRPARDELFHADGRTDRRKDGQIHGRDKANSRLFYDRMILHSQG